MDWDTRCRLAAFEHLARLTGSQPDVPVHWADLTSFEVGGNACRLIGQRGIWKPAGLALPISLTTAPRSPGRTAPYADAIRDDDTIIYRYTRAEL